MMRYRIAILLLLCLAGIGLLSLSFSLDALNIVRSVSSTPTPAPSIPFEPEKISSVTWSPDGMLAFVILKDMTTDPITMSSWLFNANQPYRPNLQARRLLNNAYSQIRFSADNQFFVTVDYQNMTRIWDRATLSVVSTIEQAETAIDLSDDGRYFALGHHWFDGCECPIWVYDISNLSHPELFTEFTVNNATGIVDLDFLSTGHLISVASGGLKIWDIENAREILTIPVAGSYNGVWTWLNQDESRLLTYTASPVNGGRGYQSNIQIWDMSRVESVSNPEELLIAEYSNLNTGIPTISPNESIFAYYTSEQSYEFVDIETGERLSRVRAIWGHNSMRAFTEDGHYLYLSRNESDELWIWPLEESLAYGMVRQYMPKIVANEAEAQAIFPDFALPTVPNTIFGD